MKRILALFLLFALFSSCKSPMSNLGDEATSPGQSVPAVAGQLASNLPPAQADSLRKVVWQQFQTQNGGFAGTKLPAFRSRFGWVKLIKPTPEAPSSPPVLFWPIIRPYSVLPA